MTSFLLQYCRVLAESTASDYIDNYDSDRFGPEQVSRKSPTLILKKIIKLVGLTTVNSERDGINNVCKCFDAGLRLVAPYVANLEWVYANLADDESRSLFVLLVAFRAIGHKRIKLPLNTPDFWRLREKAYSLEKSKEEIDPGFMGWKLNIRSLESFGYPIRLFCPPGACYTTFVHEQYRCSTHEGVIEAEEGDVVIDAGGCYGDTALYFAHKIGPRGKVISFEFLPINVSIFNKNMDLNAELKNRISLFRHPVYSTSGQKVFIQENGPGTKVLPVSADSSAVSVETMQIDDLIKNSSYTIINFIKMDIEGAELQALMGAKQTLQRFRPKLAITVYHNFSDFWTIPEYLHSLNCGYRFYLRHFTIHAEETVLFAVAN